MNANLDRRLRIIESSYGRDGGWILEHRGEPIAVLSGPRWLEMFWVGYRIEPTSADPEVRSMLRSASFWFACDFVFRSREFPDEVVDHAFGNLGPEPDEVTIRGLYISIDRPNFWESAQCFRRLARARRRSEALEGWRKPASPPT